MCRKFSFLAFAPILFLSACTSLHHEGSKGGVQITQSPDRVRVEIDGKLFTEYYFNDVIRPYFYPLLGPGEVPMTRKWP